MNLNCGEIKHLYRKYFPLNGLCNFQDVEKVIRDKEDIRKYLRRREERGDQNTRAVAIPRTVYTKRYEDP